VWNTLVYLQQQEEDYETKLVTWNQICPVYEMWEENTSNNKQMIKLQMTESHIFGIMLLIDNTSHFLNQIKESFSLSRIHYDLHPIYGSWSNTY
jgi:hypothetical protein